MLTICRRNIGVVPPKSWGPKTTYFQQLRNSMATLRANRPISGSRDAAKTGTCTLYVRQSETALETTKSPLLSQNFMNLGLLTAKNRTIVFTHPPKSSSVWRRRPSRWPVVIGVPTFLVFVSYPPTSLNGTQPKPATCSEVSAI